MNIPDIITTSTKHMTRQERRAGIRQMIRDLELLARNDGCIAAAWALEVVEAVRDRYVLRPDPLERICENCNFYQNDYEWVGDGRNGFCFLAEYGHISKRHDDTCEDFKLIKQDAPS